MRPLARRRQPTTEELLAQARLLPRIDAAAMQREADEFFGSEDRLGDDDDPFERA